MLKEDKLKELSKEEFEKGNLSYKKLKLSNRFVNKMRNSYKCVEAVENWYDSEPDVDDEEYNMYLDYQQAVPSFARGKAIFDVCLRGEEIAANGGFCEKPHTQEEMREAYEKVKKIYEDYAEERLHFCNWQEPYFEGNWGMSQRFVDRFAFLTMKKAKKGSFSQKNRFYIAKEEERKIFVFLLLRDVCDCDYHLVFEKKKR